MPRLNAKANSAVTTAAHLRSMTKLSLSKSHNAMYANASVLHAPFTSSLPHTLHIGP